MRSLRILLMVIGIALVGEARAERYAVLVGVSHYPYLSDDRQLHGPVNDVQLMGQVLRMRGMPTSNMVVLADGVPGATLPTRAAIFGALKSVGARVKPGDYVYFYFAGHGSQMPTDAAVPMDYRKPNGRQEIILPRNARGWNGKSGRVENAIADYELIREIDALRARGASVWAVFDACESATLVRGVAETTAQRTRFVDPDELGIPKRAFAKAALGSEGASPSGIMDPPVQRLEHGPSMGGYVAFYATQPHEPAQEAALPESDHAAVTHGVFSYALASALLSPNQGSYRQLGAAILRRYAADNRVLSTPLFTGTLLDAPVFGDAPVPRVLQWPVGKASGTVSVNAGLLNQVGEGAMLALVAEPQDSDEKALGYVLATRASASHADLVPIAAHGRSAPDLDSLPSGSYARLVAPTLSFVLRVGLPRLTRSRKSAEVRAIIEATKTNIPAGVHVAWCRPGAPSDIALRVQDSRIVIAPGDGGRAATSTRSQISVPVAGPQAAEVLGRDLRNMAKALNLLRIQSAVNSSAVALGLKVTLTVRHQGHESPLMADQVSTLTEDDVVLLTAENNNPYVALDVTALYINADYGIWSIPPEQPGIRRLEALSNSEHPARVTFAWRVGTEPIGLERVVLIAVTSSGSEIEDFSYLEQPSLPETRSATGDVADLLNSAGFGISDTELTRSATSKAWGHLQMDLYSFNVTKKASQ